MDGSRSLLFRGGLAATDLYQEAPIDEPAEPQTVPVECFVDGDLASLAAEGHLTGEMRAELALISIPATPGDRPEWGKRLVMVSGPATVQSGGYEGKPLRMQVTGDYPAMARGTWPPPNQQINDDTWTTTLNPLRSHGETEDGVNYPQVIGNAGLVRVRGTYAGVAATPVHPVTLDDLGGWDGLYQQTPWGDITTWALGAPPRGNFGIVSAGWLYPGTGASKGLIQITKDTGAVPPVWHTAYLYYATDGLGQTVTLARLQLPLPSWGNLATGGQYYAHIPEPCSGIARKDWRGGLEGAGEIVRWGLEQSAKRVDWRRTGAALPGLDRFVLGGFWDQSVDPWEYVASNVLPLLPATWVPGPNGIYPVVWQFGATAETATMPELIDGLNCTIEGDPKTEHKDDILSRVTVDYGNAVIDGAWRRRLVYHGGQEPDRVRSVPTLNARLAQQRWGSQVGDRMQALEKALSSDLVYRDETADRWLSWLIWLYSEPWGVYRVVGNHTSPIAHAEPGMTVPLTSSRYSLTRRVAHVRRAGWLGGMCYADLVILSAQ
jgi:hypothetical protein